MAHCSVASDRTLFGFVEVDLRSHADGCNPSKPVGYIEGYVAEHYRQQGVGRKLLGEAGGVGAESHSNDRAASISDNAGNENTAMITTPLIAQHFASPAVPVQ
jgi:GNAT superfamily N-acetyltransferase